jgi:uncharacterized protein (DUF362 family)
MEKMNRRNFIKKSLMYGATIGGAFLLGKNLIAEPGAAERSILRNGAESSALTLPDLVAVKNGEPDVMFDKAIEAFGGMSTFIKKGQTVLVKPNIGWNRTPEEGANTNPKLLKRIIEHCLNAGAKKVYVFDHTCDSWSQCYSNSGLEKIAKEAGATVAPAHTESYYQSVTINGAYKLAKTKVHELYLQSDVIINVPVLKNHSGSTITAAMKNLMGVVWDREEYHSFKGLDNCIADFCLYRKPHLNVLDAYRVMTRHGPRGWSTSDIDIKKSLLVSQDMVAIDTAGAKLMGLEPTSLAFLLRGKIIKIGNMDLDNLNIKRITL